MAWRPQIIRIDDSALVLDEAEFLASEHFTAKRIGITIDASTVGADADGNKILTKGTVMGKLASGLYGAYAPGASDGRETARGFIQESINLRYGNVTCGLIVSGAVLVARCSGLDAAARTDMPNFVYE